MDTIVLSGTGPAIRLKMGSDLHVSEDETPTTVDLIDGKSIKTVELNENLKVRFVA